VRRLFALAAIVAVLAMPGPVAAADTGASIEVGDVHLVAKVVVNAEVILTCDPKPVVEWPEVSYWGDFYGSVNLQQAVGSRMAFGRAEFYQGVETLCDGQPHTITVAISADPGGTHFKNGWAAMSAHFGAWWYVENHDTGEWYSGSSGADTGWMQVKLSK